MFNIPGPSGGGSSSTPDTSQAIGNTGVGTVTINITLGNIATATSTGATTWAFSNPNAAPLYTSLLLILTNGGSYSQTWPASVKWPGGLPPTLTSSGIDVISFFSIDGGTTYRGAVAQSDSK